jgi:superfamily II DNA or RNA helicase
MKTTAAGKKAAGKTAQKKKTTKKKPAKVSYHKRPGDLSLDLWQLGLRKQFGEDNPFEVENIGYQPVFSDFSVWNPATRNTYRVAIRSALPRTGLPKPNTLTETGNFCSCHDFKTNRLGLCKHISAVLHHLGAKVRGSKKALRAGFRQPLSCVYVDYREGQRLRLYLGSEQEGEIRAWAAQWFDAQGFLSDAGFARFETVIEEARALQPGFICYPDAFDLILEQREHERRRAALVKLAPKGPDDQYFDKLVKAELFPYQKRGVYFAAHAGRCLIADEMGLGKTVQALAAAELLRRDFGIQKAVIVCPTSLKYQWKTEIEKFSEATVNVVEGLQTKRLRQYESNEAFFQVISYNMVANDAEYINAMGADLIIIDEAQRIKNFRTKVSMQLKKVRTPLIFVLTGTPLENKLEDLYSITQFVDQHRLPPLYRYLDRYQITNENGQVVGYKNLKEIGEVMQSCMIRRTKKEVLKQLPKRMDKVLFVPMTLEQRNTHTELADAVARLVAKWRKYHFLSEKERRMLILCLSQMRMVCDSTFIIDQHSRHDTKINELLCIFEEALAEPDQKIVIFSQWERMTRLVAQELDARDIGYANLHGGVPSKDRQDLIHRFQNDADCRIFLSTDAGGVGLNLQAASMVINLDIPWNPAVLEQRIARIHRMGQQNNVTVINMVATETIEHRMLGILDFKTGMAQGVLDPDGDDTIFMSETKFKKFMENVESLTGSGWQPEPTSADIFAENAESEDFELPPTAALSEPDRVRKEAKADTFAGDDDVRPDANREKQTGQTPGDREQAGQSGASGSKEQPERTPTPAENERVSAPVPERAASGSAAPPASPQELVQAGVSFFSGLAQTLANPEKTRDLVQSIVAQDEQTGQTYLKIPVESAVKLLGGLFASFGQK